MRIDEYIKIEDRSRWVEDIKIYHPDDPRYHSYWYEQLRRGIEGYWNIDFNQYRFMPPKLYFFCNHGTIIDTDEIENTRRVVRPELWDIIWEYAYMSIVAAGFSGFKDDLKYTSDRRIFQVKRNFHSIDSQKFIDLFTPKGDFKEFVEPWEYVRLKHPEPLGLPLYRNETSNYLIMGSRGGGKSYWVSIGEILHEVLTDGIKYYTESNRKTPPTISVLVGSGDSSKSSEFCSKATDANNELAVNPLLGVYGEPGDDSYTPNQFYKDMVGSTGPNNKDNPWRHEYKQLYRGRETKSGTGSELHHVNYSEQKKDKKGAQAGAGGRYNITVVEEIGLTALVKDVYKSNDATVRIGTRYFGRQIFIGTSENIEAVQPAKEMMTNPRDYRILSIEDTWEHTGDIGFYLPAYMTDARFKDSNGNTDIPSAIKHFDEIRAAKAESSNPDILRGEKLNYPLVPSEMWLGTRAKLLPYSEAAQRERELMTDKLYLKLATPINLLWDSTQPNSIGYTINTETQPFYDFPLRSDLPDLDGSVVIYEFPQTQDGITPSDMYRFTHDPYVSDDPAAGGSLGVTHVWMNPKYWPTHLISSPLVATYIGKPSGGKKEYYSNLEKLLAFYGNPTRGLYYEADRGEFCRGHFYKKKKSHVLCLRPQIEKGDRAYASPVTQHGVIVGNKVKKITMLDDTYDWLLSSLDTQDGKKLVIETLPCIFTIRQIMAYDLDEGNFDAISSLIIYPLAIREEEHFLLEELKAKQKGYNPVHFLAHNTSIFHQESLLSRAERFNDKYYEDAAKQNILHASIWPAING